MRQAKEKAVKKEGKQGLVEERERLGVGNSPLTTCLVAGGYEEGGRLKDRTAVAFGPSSLGRVSGGDPCCTAAASTPGIHTAGGLETGLLTDPHQPHGQASGSLS